MTRYFEVMADDSYEEWERDPGFLAWTLERQRLSDLWERNYGMDSMHIFYGKCLECLQYVMNLPWYSEWCKDAFETFQTECGRLKTELETAKLTEVGLNMWKDSLFHANVKLNAACDFYRNAVKGTSDDYERLVGINGTLETCMNVIKEMLRILNPEEKKYKVWYSALEREQFLKDIGFLKGTLQATGEIQTLLGQMKKLYM